MGRRGRGWLAGAVLPGIVLLGACSPSSSGPLEGPREGIKYTTSCAPSGPEGAVFGVVLRLRSADAATITSMDFVGTNLDKAWALLDHEGVERDELIGAWDWPLSPGLGFDEALVQRAVEPVGAVVEPGTEVSLLTIIDPENDELPAELTRVSIGYDVGGRGWTEQFDTVFTAAPGDCSDPDQDSSD